MRLYTIQIEGAEHTAVETADGRLVCTADLGFAFGDMNDLIEHISPAQLSQLKEAAASPADGVTRYEKEAVRICAPIPAPKQDLICLGVNYDEHIQETTDVEDFRGKEATVYFSKRALHISGDGDPIPDYPFVDSLDYEAELGVVLGKTIRNVRGREGLEAVFGYTVINDVSGRNLQFRHKQWYRGKSLDGYTIMGPCIVTADEIEDVQNLALRCKVNGELRQSSNTRYMLTRVQEAIEELSEGMTLAAGTIIATGTPGGVGLGMKPPTFLQQGDIVECSIEGIGSITNTVEVAS